MVQALYVDVERGPYPNLLGAENCWGKERDARRYCGPDPVVAHPACGPWGRLAHLCTKQDPDDALAAVAQVRRFGGVLEHPAGSRLWDECELPSPFLTCPGIPLWEWSLAVDQCDWGHPARKRTWLLFVGIPGYRVARLGRPPVGSGVPTHVIDTNSKHKNQGTGHLTPPRFAEWLIACARLVG